MTSQARWLLPLVGVFALVLSGGCSEAYLREVEAQSQARMAREQAIERILVTPGDFSGRRYRILGTVKCPEGSDTGVRFGRDCTPEDLKRLASHQYGAVDAIIGYTTWRDQGATDCSGTAINFEE